MDPYTLVHYYFLSLQQTRFFPLLPQRPNLDRCRAGTSDIFGSKEVILTAKCKKMSKKRVKMRFRTEMEDLGVMCMVDVSKNSKELPVYMLDYYREILGEILA